MRLRAGRLAALLAVLFGAGLLLAAPASAHASVVRSDPADGSRLAHAPAAVSFTFDENVGIGGVGYLHVADASGARVDAGAAFHPDGDGAVVRDRLRSGLGDGTFTASFRVVSADSHPVAGTIRFTVGDGALVHGSVTTAATNGSTATAFDVVRWVSFAGLALFGGTWLLLSVWPVGLSDRRARELVFGGIAVTAVGAVLEFGLQGAYAAGAGPVKILDVGLLDDTLHSGYGRLHVARIVLLGLLALLLARGSGRLRAAAAPVLAVGIALTFSAAGHAGTTPPTPVSVPLDALHLLAMAAWLGGLIMLLGAVLPRREPDELRAVLPVFSRVAFTSVVVLALTGTYAAWRGVGTVHTLFTTSYGLLVAGKAVLFVLLVSLGNLSRVIVQRRFARSRAIAYAMTDTLVDEPRDDAVADVPADAERLRRSVYAEMLVGLLVLALTAALVAQPRGKEALTARYREAVTASAPLGNGASVLVTSDPGTHGTVQLGFTLVGTHARQLTATATDIDAEIGPIPVTLTAAGAGTYSGAAALPVAGRWRIDLVVTRSAFDAVTTDTTLVLH